MASKSKRLDISKVYNIFSTDQLESIALPVDIVMKKQFGNGVMKLRPIRKGFAYCVYDFFSKKDITVFSSHFEPVEKIWFSVCLLGTSSFTFKDREVSLFPGYSDVFVGGFDKGIKHEIKKNIHYKLVSVIFEADSFYKITGKKPEDIYHLNKEASIHPQQKIPKEMRVAAQHLASLNQNNALPDLFFEAKALELVSYKIGELESIHTRIPLDNQKEKSYIEKIMYAAEIMAENIVDPPGIFDISNQVGLNHNKLTRGFKDVFSLTPFEYLTKIRLKKAADLIENERVKITEAAFSVGYSNLSHFARIFKREFGLSPSQFRKKE